MLIELEWNPWPITDQNGVIVRMGETHDDLKQVGMLVLSYREATRFRQTVRQGIQGDGFRGIFEEGWEEVEAKQRKRREVAWSGDPAEADQGPVAMK